MARIVYYNRTRETTSGTPGTSTTITLTGASTGHRTFGSHSDLVVGDTFYYLMEDLDDNDWEIGLGVWQGSNTFDRPTTVLDNSSGGTSKINFGSNSEVALIWSAEAVDDIRINQLDKLVLTSTSIVDVFLYDTSLDSDAGAWRKKTRNTSWYQETLESATRGATKEFPKVALIVAETDTVTIYDATREDVPMWMVFNGSAQTIPYINVTNVTAVTMQNGLLAITTDGLCGAHFILDDLSLNQSGAFGQKRNSWVNIANRGNSGTAWLSSQNTWLGGAPIVNNGGNGVAITTLSGAETDPATDLPFPTIACATDGGVSVINHDGSLANVDVVVDLVDVSGDDYNEVTFNEDGDILGTNETQGNLDIWRFGNYTADSTTPDVIYDNATIPALSANPTTTLNGLVDLGSDVFAIGSVSGVSIVAEDTTTQASGMMWHFNKDYTTGWMPGDIRFAGLANSKTLDRSVKGNDLTENGTVTESAVATGAELKAYSGFSASNYLSRAYDADFDFGTGDFCIAVWAKISGAGTERIISRAYHTGAAFSGSGIQVYFDAGVPRIDITDDGFSTSDAASGGGVNANEYSLIVGARDGSDLKLYVDGILVDTTTITSATGSLDNVNATLRIGGTQSGGSSPNVSASLPRISAYAPTAAQIKKMYNDEKWMFRDNADCLLGGTSDNVKALSYDSTSDRLFVSTADKTSVFQKFNRLETIEATGNNTLTSDDHVAVSAQSEYYSIGSAAEANVQVPEKSLADLA